MGAMNIADIGGRGSCSRNICYGRIPYLDLVAPNMNEKEKSAISASEVSSTINCRDRYTTYPTYTI